MTSASYAWRTINTIRNSGFETGSGTTFTGWTTSGSVAEITSSPGAGSRSLGLDQNAYAYENISFATASGGRFIDPLNDLFLSLLLKTISGTVDKAQIKVFITDSSDNLLHYYDFHAAVWRTIGSYTVVTSPGAFGIYMTDGGTWTSYKMPKIYAPAEATTAMVDGNKFRVLIANSSSGTSQLGVDTVLLQPWNATAQTLRLGSHVVAFNGRDYPVKYDLNNGTITEQSLHPPYHTANSALPTVAQLTSGGFMKAEKYYGIIYAFKNGNTGELSALPLGIHTSSGGFTQQTGAGTNVQRLTLDFSAITVPNQDKAHTTDLTEPSFIVVFRTIAYDQEADAAFAVAAGLNLYYDGEVALGGTFTCSQSDDDLQEKGQMGQYFADPTQAPSPLYSVATVWRNRLWVAGGPEFRYGKCDVTNGSATVVGVNDSGANAGTWWNRGIEGMVFSVSGGSRDYDVESFWYQNDNGSPSTESLALSQTYAGSTVADNAYTIRPKNGRVWFSAEGEAHKFSWTDGFFITDGDNGDSITGLVSQSDLLIACSPRATFGFKYEEYPTEAGNVASNLSRTIGCIGSRSMVEILDAAYWLSHEGVVALSRGDLTKATKPSVMSAELRKMFVDPDDPDYILRRASTQLADIAVATHYAPRNQYLLAVRTASGGIQGADTVLAYNYLHGTWDVLKVSNGIVNWFHLKDFRGRDGLYFTDAYGYVWRWDTGTVDAAGENNNHGKLRATVASAGSLYAELAAGTVLFTSSKSQNFSSATLGLDGAWCEIVRGTGVGQKRRIQKNTATRIYLDEEWDTTPDTTSVIEIGSIDFRWRLKQSYCGRPSAVKTIQNIAVDYVPQDLAARADIKVYPESSGQTWDEIQSEVNLNQKPAQDEVFPSQFRTNGAGRALVPVQGAEGYAVSIEFVCDGPEAPMVIRGLGAVYRVKEEDLH